MADNQAEEDDDESFGDFKFASFPNQPLQSNQMSDDDDWGDFMNHSNQINGGFEHSNGFFPSQSPSELFQVSSDTIKQQSFHGNELSRVEESETPKWNKPQGAIPLSIFGEEEGEEHRAGNLGSQYASNVFSNQNGVSAEKGSDSNGVIRFNDLIVNLYDQNPKANSENGSILVSSGIDLNLSGASSNGNSAESIVAAPNSDTCGLNSNLSNLNSDSVDRDEDVDEDDEGWEFRSAEPEAQIKDENYKVDETRQETIEGAEFSFAFDNGLHDVGNNLDLSCGISNKTGEWNLGFEFSPSSALQDTKTGSSIVIENFGEFKDKHSDSGPNHNLEAAKLTVMYPASVEALKFDGQGPLDPNHPSLASVDMSYQSDGWSFGFNVSPRSLGEDQHISESYSKNKQDDNDKNFNAFSTNTNVDSDANLFAFKDAVAEIGTWQEKSQISTENRKDTLPLSNFGDEMPDTEENSVNQDFSPFARTSSIRNSFNSPISNLSINDLIWSLYSQSENKTSNSTPKAIPTEIHATSSVNNDSDDFNDDYWEFKDALSETRFGIECAQNTSNHVLRVSENGRQTAATGFYSDLINGGNAFEDDSWGFKDAVSITASQGQASVIDHGHSSIQLSTKSEHLDCVDIYGKLTDELCNAVMCNLHNLKKAQSTAVLSGEDAKARALEELSDILNQNNIIPNQYLSEDYSPRNMCLDELLNVLREPVFQSVESEYQLTSRLSMAGRDIRSAIELLKEVVSTLGILNLRSREEQSKYLTSWSKIVFVCSQELKHGAFIWKESLERNFQDHVLSNPKGFQYFHALGEVYRVAEMIGVSAKLYKPWILSSSLDPKTLFVLLSECYTIWSGSGLEEALSRISNQMDSEHNGVLRELLESIKCIQELDEHALQNYIISGQETTCQLSALPACFIPGLKMVQWNGKHYFLTIANLWVNLVSSGPPE